MRQLPGAQPGEARGRGVPTGGRRVRRRGEGQVAQGLDSGAFLLLLLLLLMLLMLLLYIGAVVWTVVGVVYSSSTNQCPCNTSTRPLCKCVTVRF